MSKPKIKTTADKLLKRKHFLVVVLLSWINFSGLFWLVSSLNSDMLVGCLENEDLEDGDPP